MKDQYLTRGDKLRLSRWQIEESAHRVSFVSTADGWDIAVSHYSSQPTREYPVLLCHGMGANRLSFDINQQASLARHLVEAGYDVYSVDLRGHGRSQKSGPQGKKHWGFNDYCLKDLPVVFEFILQQSGKEALHYIGHSMGGLLLYAHAALGQYPIKSGIALGSSLDYRDTDSVFTSLVNFAPLARVIPKIPVHWMSQWSSWASCYTGSAIDTVLVHPRNVELLTYRQLTATGLHPVSAQVMSELTGAVTEDGVRHPDGWVYADRLKQGYAFPVLAMAGTRDRQCPPEAALRFGTEHQIFGKAHGHKEEYGHDDLVMGRHVHNETWPQITRWLEQQEAA